MHKLLYYPNFEIQDQNFLKFALLYIDEIRPIIPESARASLSNSMQDILKNTNLINPYSPNYSDGHLASIAAIQHLEQKEYAEEYNIERYNTERRRNYHKTRNYTLYLDKYTSGFENYCLENSLCERCKEGILLNQTIAYAYMSILAEIISKETEMDMITDITKYSDPVLRDSIYFSRKNINKLDLIQKEIQFYVPVDMHKIPLNNFVRLRSDDKFETARKNFVAELNTVLDSYDNDSEVDLNNIVECKKEFYKLFKELFISCATVAVGVHSFGTMCKAEKGTLDFWANMGNIGISLDTLKQHCYEAKEYAARIKRKRQARKYLAKLKQLRPETL